MTLDTSAILAVLLREPEAGRMIAAIDAALFRRLSAASLLEAAIPPDSTTATASRMRFR